MHIMFRLIALIIMFLSMQAAYAAEVGDGSAVQMAANDRPATLPPAYPEWPEQKMYVEAVPAPPLGPYMSTGLTGTGRNFACCEEREKRAMPPIDSMPWPERRRPPQQWLPEDGQYSFAPGNMGEAPVPPQPDRYGNWARQPWQPMYQYPPQGRYR